MSSDAATVETLVSVLELMEDGFDRAVQRIFAEHGPARDRHTAWRACDQEPWRSLAGIDITALFTDALDDAREFDT